jgi:hypothetical protein
MQSLINHNTVLIANNASLSAPFQLRAQPIIRIWAPSLWTTAVLTFQGSRDGANWDDLYDQANAELSLAVTQPTSPTFERSYAIPREWTLGCEYIRFRSGTAISPVNQLGDRIIGFSFRPFA